MARALMGHVGMPSEPMLAYEVARLRRRVAELEAELQQMRQNATEVMDLELHRITEASAPVLA